MIAASVFAQGSCGPNSPNAQFDYTSQLWVCPNGATTNVITGQTTGPTNTSVNTSPAQPCTNCNLGYTPLEPIPGFTSGTGGQGLDFPSLLGNVYKIAITLGALFSVLMLTINGIRYMLSDVVTDKARAITRIKACLWGLLLIAVSWLILNTINPQLVKFTLNPGATASQTQGGITAASAGGTAGTGGATGAISAQTVQLSTAQQTLIGSATDNALLINTSDLSGVSSAMQTFSASCPSGTWVSQGLPGTIAGGTANQTAFVCETPNTAQIMSQAQIF